MRNIVPDIRTNQERQRGGWVCEWPLASLTAFRKTSIIRTVSLLGIGTCREKSENYLRPLNHRKSDSYAAPAAECRSAGAGISNPKGGGPSPGCRPEVFPVRAPRRDRNPDRLPPRATRQRAL